MIQNISAKTQLRRQVKQVRDGMASMDRAAASQAIAERFMQHAALLTHGADKGPISAYWPIRSEVDPLPLLAMLAGAGMATSLPVVTHPTLSFRLWRPGDPVVDAGFGTSGPSAHGRECAPAIVLVPCLAFDRGGGRLGYGAGHFDRALERLRANAPTRVVALAFAAQQVESTFGEAHDQPLDAIVTERELILPQSLLP